MNPHPQPRIFLVLRHARWLCVSSVPADHVLLLLGLYPPTQSGSYPYHLALQLPHTDGNSTLAQHHYLLYPIQNP